MKNTNVKLSQDNLMLIFVAGLASYLDSALLVSLGVSLPIWTDFFSFNGWLVGIVSTLLTISVGIGSFFGGWLSDKFGRIRVFNIDILFVAVGSFIIAMAHNVIPLLIGIVIAGLASGADLPTSLAVISERMKKGEYGRAISSTQIFWTVGILLSQLIGFLTANNDMGSPKVLFGWISLVALINWFVRVFSKRFQTIEKKLVVNNNTPDESGKTSKNVVCYQLFKNKTVLLSITLLTVFYLFWNLPANTWGTFVNYFLVTVDGQTQAYSTIVAIVANVACLISTFIYFKIADTRYRYPAMYFGLVVGLISFLVASIYSANWQVFTIAYICYSASNILWGEALYKIWTQSFYSVNVRASLTGISYGIVRTITAIFSLVTPVLMSYDAKLLLWIMVGCTFVSGICATIIVKNLTKFKID